MHRWHTLAGCHAQADVTQCVQSIQMSEKIRLSSLQRSRPQKIQVPKVFVVPLEQRPNEIALVNSQPINHGLPQTPLCAFPNAAHQALQGGGPRKQYPVADQPIAGPFNQSSGLILTAPAEPVEATHQTQASIRRLVEITVSKTNSDQRRMSFVCGCRAVEIFGEVTRHHLVQLVRDIDDHLIGDVGTLVDKSSGKPDAAQQDGETQSVGSATHLPDGGKISSIKVKVSRQLLWGRRSSKSPKGVALIRGQKRGGHGVRNSRHLRRQTAARKTKDKSFAKYMCETNYFSNMIRAIMEAAA